MVDLYLISFAVGLVLFLLVIAYSLHQKKSAEQAKQVDLFDERVAPNVDQPQASVDTNISDKTGLVEPELDGSGEILGEYLGANEESDELADDLDRDSGLGLASDANSDPLDGLDAFSDNEIDESLTQNFEKASLAEKKAAALSKAKSALSALKKSARDKHANMRAKSTKSDKIEKERSNSVPNQADTPVDAETSGHNTVDERIEPIVDSHEHEAAEQTDASFATNNASNVSGSVEPSLGDAITASPQQAPASSTNANSAPASDAKVFKDADSVITDLVARVLNPGPIEQSDLLSLFREHDFKFSRKVHIYGLNELTDMWRDIEFELPTARFLELGISIQLCDREGAMNEKELYDFQQMIYQFCERYDAPFEFSMNIDAALQQAQILDQIGRRYDCMAVLNVVPKSKSGFRMTDIQSCARDLMMSTDKNGIFMKTEGQKNNITVLYRLACTDGEGHFGVGNSQQASAIPVHDLVVYMNVPATRDPEVVFQQMVQDANDLATWLDGKVVDRAGKVMNQRTYATLMQQISDIAYSMQQDGLMPGDAVAKKLF